MFRLIRDDDGHWYVIKAGQEEVFERWCRWMENYQEGDYDGPEFEALGGGPGDVTFPAYSINGEPVVEQAQG